MKKIIFCIFLIFIAATLLTLPIAATETDSGAFDSTPVETVFGEEEISEVIDILENSESKSDSILALVEKLGITVEEAENIINTFIALGDEYFGESDTWVKFSRSISDDLQFWAIVIVAIAAILSIGIFILILVTKINPNSLAAKYFAKQSVEFNEGIAKSFSQTLENLNEMFADVIEKEEAFEIFMTEKENAIEALETKIAAKEEANGAERHDMLASEVYILRMLKLILDRTPLPIADRATIDLFYSKGVSSIKNEMSDEDFQKIEEIMSTLDKVGVTDGDGQA